jgi:diguanylate cyclase (GGDEF)-like protein
MNEADRMTERFDALVKAFLGISAALPKTAAPASPDLARQCKETFEEITGPLSRESAAESIEHAGRVVVKQVEEIARSNQAAMDQCDVTMKEVVTTVAAAIGGFKGHGERHETSFTKLADSFESLARIDDLTDLRRRLQAEVGRMRQSVEQMRVEGEESLRQFESQIFTFQQRLEAARKGSKTDRLTQLGSRREAERYLQQIPKAQNSVCVLLFDIEDFSKINERHGAVFADKLLQALAHMLLEIFPGEGLLFRWGSDEFLAIAEGLPSRSMDLAKRICQRFANSNYTTFEKGRMVQVGASLAWGAAEYSRGESVAGLCLRARDHLEENRKGARR